MRIRTLVVAVAIAVAALAATGVAVGVPSAATAFDSEQPAYYSGCITANGRLEAMAVGLSPKRACTSAEKPVHVSGGDITSIQGANGIKISSDPIGLVDGSGSARIEIMGRYRLPATCQTGETPVWGGTEWKCQAPAPRGKVVHGFNTTGGIVGNDWSVVGKSMTVPAGNWVLVAKLRLVSNWWSQSTQGECRLDVTDYPGRDANRVQAWVSEDLQSYSTRVSMPLTLTAVTTQASPFAVAVVCRDLDEADMHWDDLRITAIEAGSISLLGL